MDWMLTTDGEAFSAASAMKFEYLEELSHAAGLVLVLGDLVSKLAGEEK